MKWDESIRTPEGRRRHAYFQDDTRGHILTDFNGQRMTLEETPGWKLVAEAERGAGRAWHVDIYVPGKKTPVWHFAFTKDQAIEIMLKETP